MQAGCKCFWQFFGLRHRHICFAPHYTALWPPPRTTRDTIPINEIRQFLEGWLSVLPPATLLPGVLALQNRWHGGQVFGKLAALYACTVMLVITFITGTNMGGLLISQLLPSLWGWWEILFRQHGWGGTIYDLEHCDYSFSSTVLWMAWIGIVSSTLFAAWFLCIVRARISRLVQWFKQRG